MKDLKRNSGIDVLGNISWGTHFCQFYETREDLIEILVPYFEAGLKNNEFCMWITSDPLNHEEVKRLMRKKIPEFDEYLKKGQIEIIPYTEWYLIDGKFDFQRVLSGWIEKLEKALKSGYDGLRLTGNTFWLEGKGIWDDFAQYEHEVNKIIGNYKMIAICTYSLVQCGASEILEVVNTHQFALLKHKGSWKLIESSELKETKHILRAEIVERKRAEDESKRSQELLIKAEKLSHTGAWEWDLIKNQWKFSDEWLAIHGYQKSNLSTEELLPIAHPDDRAKIERAFEDVRNGLKPYSIEHRIIRQDTGEIRTVKSYGELVVDAQGIPLKVLGVAQDITERKQAEEALHESEERLRLAQANANIGVWDWRPQTGELIWSPDLEKLYGLTPGTIKTYQDWQQWVHPDDIIRIESEQDEAIARHEPFNLEFRIFHSSGEIRWINTKGKAIYDEANKVLRLTGINMDITDRKRTEEALRESKEQLRLAQVTSNKELKCLFDLSSIADTPNLSLNQLIDNVVQIIPPGWQYPDSTCARILYKQQEFKTKNFQESHWKLSAPILEEERKVGELEVFYLEEKPELAEGPFLIEERNLIQAISERLGHILERLITKEKLNHLNLLLRIIRNINQLITKEFERHKLIQGACNSIIEHPGYSNAWIVLLNSHQKFIMAAESGFKDDFSQILEKLRQNEFPRCIQEALKQSNLVKVKDVISNFSNGPSANFCLNKDIMSAKLEYLGKIYGVLTVAPEPNYYQDEEELALLKELANDIAFALHKIDLEEERKITEEILRISEEKYRMLIETMNDGLVLQDDRGTITYINSRLYQMLGYSQEEMVGQPWQIFFDEGSLKTLSEQMARGEYNEQGAHEISCNRKDGQKLSALISEKLVKDPDGNIKGSIGVITDLTEHKRAEAAILEMASYNRSLIEASLDPLVTIGKNGKITDVNHATELVTGRDRNSLIGTDFSIYFTDPTKALLGYKTVFETGFVQDFELELRHMDGHITPVMYNAAVFKDKEGNIKGIFAAARDITERKRSDERIQEQTALLNNAHDAIIVVDPENRITYWNKGAVALYGWTEEEVKGKNMDELLFKKEPAILEEARKNIIAKGEWRGELPQTTKKEKDIIVESSWTLTRDKKGKPQLILVINTDITEKKNLESQLLRSQRLESIYTITGGIAHDLNNVLTPIMLSGNILKRKITDEQGKTLLNIITENSQRGANLIKQIMLFARGIVGERAEIQVPLIMVELEKILTETFPKNIETKSDIKKDVFAILGDETQLHQVLINLCVNARDAMPDGGTLRISAENVYVDENYARLNLDAKVGPYVMVSVADTGIGIPSEIKDKLFIPFFTTKGVGRGTGLGLSTALGIVRSHGGFINVYSELGKGSIFKVYLPAYKKEGLQGSPEQQPASPVGRGELVFVVDDEPQIVKIIQATLEDNGYKVVTAADGAEAVAIYAQKGKEINVLLMDMMMPTMDGPTTIRVLRKINPDVKIIGTSGLLESSNFNKAVQESIQGFIPKPCTAEKLLTTIREVLDKK